MDFWSQKEFNFNHVFNIMLNSEKLSFKIAEIKK